MAMAMVATEISGRNPRRLCALQGCERAIAESVSSSGSSHLACGQFHHFLLMASRFDPSSPPPHAPLLDRNSHGLCGLSSCSNPLDPLPRYGGGGGHFCCRSHHLAWLSDFCRHRISARQMCKLQGCARHVFVEEVSEEGGENLISDKGGDEKNSGDAPAWSRPKPRGRVHEFCGWRHRQDYTMLQAYSLREQQSPPLHKDGDHPSSSSLIKG